MLLKQIHDSSAADLHRLMMADEFLSAVLLLGMHRTLAHEDRLAMANARLLATASIGLIGSLFMVDKGFEISTALTVGIAFLAGIGWYAPRSSERKIIRDLEAAMLRYLANWVNRNGMSHLPECSPGSLLAHLNLREDLWTLNRSGLRLKADRIAKIDPQNVLRYDIVANWAPKVQPIDDPDLKDFSLRLEAARARYPR